MSKVVSTPVTPVKLHLVCDCGGVMNHDGITWPTHPPRFTHVCEACGQREGTTTLYPTISYQEVAE